VSLPLGLPIMALIPSSSESVMVRRLFGSKSSGLQCPE
jgi:hypothetical protein